MCSFLECKRAFLIISADRWRLWRWWILSFLPRWHFTRYGGPDIYILEKAASERVELLDAKQTLDNLFKLEMYGNNSLVFIVTKYRRQLLVDRCARERKLCKIARRAAQPAHLQAGRNNFVREKRRKKNNKFRTHLSARSTSQDHRIMRIDKIYESHDESMHETRVVAQRLIALAGINGRRIWTFSSRFLYVRQS